MQRNRLGQSDLFVGEVSFGCMSLPSDEAEGIRMLHEAVHRGVNFFDTADLYGQGQNEELVGKAFRDHRRDVVIATKVGNRWTKGEPGWTWGPTKEYILEAVHHSLRRLQTDYIDLYQLHGGTIEDPIDDIIEAFEELQQQGLIRAYGISSIRPNVIREYVKKSRIASVMMQYSILDRRPEETILSLLQDSGISVIARGPVARGLLSDRTLKAGAAASGFLDYSEAEVFEVVKQLSGFVSESRTLGQVALRYPLAHPTVRTIIPGASRVEQLIENIAAASAPELTEAELESIRAWSKANVYQNAP